MSLLVFGRTGQVARELVRRAPCATFLSRTEANLREPQRCAEAILASGATAIVNAAAYTAVDAAETDWETALLVNATAPAAMACAAAAKGIPFVTMSTDYVFDGSGSDPFTPDHPPAPLNAYGRSKAMGEDQIRSAGGAAAILRTSWVFSGHGSNFVKTLVTLAGTRESIAVVADQVGGPTPAGALAEALLMMTSRLAVRPDLAGTYHLSGWPDVRRSDFARAIMLAAGLETQIVDVETADLQSPAARPLNSRLDCSSFTRCFGTERPSWRAALGRLLEGEAPE
jgi:dTDP-4-dehydrorhamnose reductase